MQTERFLLSQVLKPGQIELTAQVQVIGGRVPGVDTKLVERFNRECRVLAAQVRGQTCCLAGSLGR